MIGIGIAGLGFMGMIHYLAAKKVAAAKVVALNSRDPKKLAGDWTSIQGNFGPRGTQMDLTGVAAYADYAAMLADPAVQLVDLCVSNDSHAAMAIQALEAGKHVLVEKPIALTTDDADAMLAAAKANGRLLMVAHVLPFFPEWAYAAEAVRSGRYGKLKAAHLTRVIARPAWSDSHLKASRSGGPAIDLHIHDTHFVGLVCGTPRAVQSRGVVEGDAVVHLATQYLYDDPNLAVSALSGALSHAGRPFTHDFAFYLERAAITYSLANFASPGPTATPLSVILPDGTVERPALGSSDPIDAFAAEIQVACDSIARGEVLPALSPVLARNALRICHAEVESVKTRTCVTL